MRTITRSSWTSPPVSAPRRRCSCPNSTACTLPCRVRASRMRNWRYRFTMCNRSDHPKMNRHLLLASWFFPLLLTAQTAPHFEVDPSWPKPLPEGWITGQLGGVCTDSHDHIVIVNRRDITAEEAETSQQAPPIIMFDMA